MVRIGQHVAEVNPPPEHGYGVLAHDIFARQAYHLAVCVKFHLFTTIKIMTIHHTMQAIQPKPKLAKRWSV